MDENPYKSPSDAGASASMASPSFLRRLGVTLARIVATLFVLTPLALITASPSLFVGYLWSLIPITCFLLFPTGVYLHWLIAKTTDTYSGWVYWLIFLVTVPMLSAVPIGTIAGGIAIVVLYTSDTFQQMRNGKRSRRDEPSAIGPPP